MKYTVTGATGNLGSRVVKELLKHAAPHEVRAAVHTLTKAGDLKKQGVEVTAIEYLDTDSIVKVFKETDVLIYIPSKTYNVLQRITEFENTLQAVKESGVKKIVFVGFIADQENNPFQMSSYYAYAPRRLAGLDIQYAVVKNVLYADPLVPYLPELIERENIIYPIKDQALSFITLQDSAEAIAKVALNANLRNNGQSYLLTQSRNYDMVELSQVLSEATGEKIGYEPASLEEFAEIYNEDGTGRELASMYKAGGMGLLNTITEDFKFITGHDPQVMERFIQEGIKK